MHVRCKGDPKTYTITQRKNKSTVVDFDRGQYCISRQQTCETLERKDLAARACKSSCQENVKDEAFQGDEYWRCCMRHSPASVSVTSAKNLPCGSSPTSRLNLCFS